MWAAYYDYHTTQDTLMIIFEPNKYPTRIEKKDEVVAIYENDLLIGVNILHFSDTIKMKLKGRITSFPPIVLKVINDKLVNAGLDKLQVPQTSGFIVATVMKILGNQVTLLLNNEVVNLVTNLPLKEKLKVVIAKKGTILFNLEKVDEDYLILNGIQLGYDGQDVYYVDNKITSGSDYFSNEI